jgi:natural product biosynthesis luciferase-like monooxygenase protein
MSKEAFSCYLIGADTLLIECGEVLLSKNHNIKGVITSTQRIIQWAQQKSIPVIGCQKGYEEQLQSQEFDYLFSITHLAIIKDDVLTLPKKGAINFHDGPLPRYAGLNTPAWALINNEQQYGISWHEITPGVDQGDIVKQVIFDIAPNETSLSINTKCFAAALESFPVLIDELASNSNTPVSQDLSKRSYFGKYDRPEADGLLQWDKSAKQLERMIRAMDFGDHPNLLVLPKVFIKDQVFAVQSSIVRETDAGVDNGQIVEIQEGQIDVATGDGVLSLTKFKDLSGKIVTPGELQNQLGLVVGDSFGVIDPTMAESIANIGSQLVRSDEYWAKSLACLDPVELPYGINESTTLADIQQYAKHDVKVPPGLSSAIENVAVSQTIISAFSILLSRLSRKSEFDIAFVNKAISRASQVVPSLYSEFSVLHLSLDTQKATNKLIDTIADQVAKTNERGGWAKDLIGRTPALQLIPELVSGTALPVGVAVGEDHAIAGTALTLSINEEGNAASLHYNGASLGDEQVSKFVQQLEAVLSNLIEDANRPACEVELLTQEEKRKILADWNNTTVDYDDSHCIHNLFEQQVTEHPNATALVYEDETITYAALNNKSNQLARLLIDKGVGPDDLVGVNVNRSINLMVATLAVQKAGAAYVPLDPDFPAERIAYMVKDSAMKMLITQEDLQATLPENNAEIICVDSIAYSSDEIANPDVEMTSANLAYVIYTSGSTGNPKGVMVEHRNVTNFFMGMDDRIDHKTAGVWLAVTSLSFDISVLELFWTLTRGFKVIIYREDRGAESGGISKKIRSQPMEFGLFMWGNDDAPGSEKYRLLIEGAKYFDQNGFNSVWTPERHFSAFGGPYPNPAVTSAALATITKNLSIRSGSIVSPLHHPVRIAEDWAVIDNLSDGRVGLSFAAGWQPNDFVIMPQNHKNNKEVMVEQIDIVKRLWRGEKVAFKNPMGDMVETATLPRPVQKELPLWFTAAGNPESYRMAGEMGMNILTHLLGQNIEEVTEKIRIYRKAREEAGFDPATGKVTLMLHTFVGTSDSEVREVVRQPMKEYLRSAIKIVIDFAWSFPAFKRPGGQDSKPEDIDLNSLSAEEIDTILDFAFERYFETSGLFGTPETCLKMVNRCKVAGIDEIASLLDFGVDTEAVMESLPMLKEVRDMANAAADSSGSQDSNLDQTLPAQLERHQVTHFQCSPSMAQMLCFDEQAKIELSKLKHMMVGGEAFPNSLAKNLKSILNGRLTNMYGPTEATIWSTTQDIDNPENIPIGKPIANTDIYILDENRQPLPIGVPGDLYIGGQGVVRGYLNRPELTEERFVPSPFKQGERIYWTGDLAKYRDDGVIEFLGRVDHQVKIRGYRIELGEIENKLSSHASVLECVLLLREDTPGDQRLVAYIVAAGSPPEAKDIREHLRKDLPEYMVPNDVVVLDSMPLTPNGKLDRKQLPLPQGVGQPSAAVYEAPKDELQQIIVNVWQETLNIDKVGVKDNFFDLGGHSLLIIRVHQQLKKQLETPISLTDLYRFPTITSLTDFLNSDQENETLKKSSDRASRRRERMGLRKRGRK